MTAPISASGAEVAPEPSKLRDVRQIERALTEWLPARVAAGDVHDLRVGNFQYPVGAGASNETILFDCTWTEGGETRNAEWVLRIHPDQNQLFLETNFRKQFDLLSVLHHEHLVKVPEPMWYEEDTALLGQPFFVMSRLRGRVPVSRPVYNESGWLVEATPAQRRTVWDSAFREFARLQSVPVDLVRFLDDPELGPSGLEQQLTYWERSIPWSTGGSNPPFLLEVAEWLRTNAPVERRDGLSWGDARMGNMMFGDDYRLVGVMDWEQASLAGGLRDLGWWLFFDECHSTALGIPRLDGLGSRDETLDLWEELVGERPPDLRWYEVFTGFSVLQLSLRTALLRGAPGGGSLVGNPFLAQTCDLLGWPLPKTP